MKVVVAGGSGFVGRHVVSSLRERGHRVVVVDRGTRPAPEAVDHVACDLVRDEVPLAALAGAEALVNLVGIKRGQGAQTFEAVHVEVTGRLIAAARTLGIGRFVHLSVVCARQDPDSPYHDTKWRAEELLRESEATILRAAVIYGRGDDMVTHLVKMIRFAPLFPIVGKGRSLLQPVDVRDVAEAVVAALERPVASGRTYDVVGPERLALRTVVRTVAEGMGLPLAPSPAIRCGTSPSFSCGLTPGPEDRCPMGPCSRFALTGTTPRGKRRASRVRPLPPAIGAHGDPTHIDGCGPGRSLPFSSRGRS